MIAAPPVARPQIERLVRLRQDARLRGYTLSVGYPEQGGYWLALADSLNSMARWLPDLDAVEQALEKVAE